MCDAMQREESCRGRTHSMGQNRSIQQDMIRYLGKRFDHRICAFEKHPLDRFELRHPPLEPEYV